MKKNKILITILGLSSIASAIVPIASCSMTPVDPDEPETELKFVCQEPNQTTVRGETVCWYMFSFEGDKEIPNDLSIKFDQYYKELNIQILSSIVEGSGNKQIKVGIQGMLKYVQPDSTINFKFVFKSDELVLNQAVDCSYTYLKSMIKANGERNSEMDAGGTEVFQDFDFIYTDGKRWEEREMVATPINITKSDGLNITPSEIVLQNTNDSVKASVKFETDGKFQANQWINFDIQFEDKKNGWMQVIKNYHFNINPVAWTQYQFNKQTEVVVDWKGDKQNALKVVDSNDQGILPKGTAVGTPFELWFDLSTWPKDWYQKINQWKFGSYKHPTEAHVEYYCFSSISVWIDDGSGKLTQLPQTEPADHEGVNGLWWKSDGGPITVLYKKVKEQYPSITSIVYRLRTADPIEFDSSFYVTYA